MKDVSWINHPSLKDLDARKLAVLVDLVNEAEGKPLDKTLPILMSANMKLRSQNLSFNPQETTVIMEILTKGMSAEEKTKLSNLRNMMENKVKEKGKKK